MSDGDAPSASSGLLASTDDAVTDRRRPGLTSGRRARRRGGRGLGVAGPRACSAPGAGWSCSSAASTSTTCWPRHGRPGRRRRGRARRPGSRPRRRRRTCAGTTSARSRSAGDEAARTARGARRRRRAGQPTTSSTCCPTRSRPTVDEPAYDELAAAADAPGGPGRRGRRPGGRVDRRLGPRRRTRPDHRRHRAGRRARRPRSAHDAGRRRPLRRRRRPAARRPRRGLRAASAARLAAAGGWRRGSPRVQRALDDRPHGGHRAAPRRTAGSRSGPASSSTCSRSRAGTATWWSTPASASRTTRRGPRSAVPAATS